MNPQSLTPLRQLPGISVSWGCWNTYYRHLFLTLLEAGSPRSRCQQGWFLLRPLSLACRVVQTQPHLEASHSTLTPAGLMVGTPQDVHLLSPHLSSQPLTLSPQFVPHCPESHPPFTKCLGYTTSSFCRAETVFYPSVSPTQGRAESLSQSRCLERKARVKHYLRAAEITSDRGDKGHEAVCSCL